MTVLSIIIPTYNRAYALAACLDSLIGQSTGAGEHEIIVVDDGSSDGTAEVCRSRGHVKYFRQENQGVASARNLGVKSAQGRWLVFVDDDELAHPGWLQTLYEAGGGDEELLVGGPVINALKDNVYAEASQSLLDYVYAFYNQDPKNMGFIAGGNIMVSKRRFLELGGFNPRYVKCSSEDRDFCRRWLQSGGRLRYVPEAILDHCHQMGFRGFCKQHYHYGRGAWLFHEAAFKGQTRDKTLEKPGFYWGLVTHPLNSPGGLQGLKLSGLIFFSQVVTTLGLVREAMRKRQ